MVCLDGSTARVHGCGDVRDCMVDSVTGDVRDCMVDSLV